MAAVACRDRLRSARVRGALLAALLCAAWPAHGAEPLKLPTPTAEEREDDIRRARVCEPTDVASKDLYNGPHTKLNYAVDGEVTCEFVPKQMGGLTQKFLCKLDNGHIVKVKYEEGHRFKEVFGEVLGTRLFWALGFYADKMLPVRVTCVGCPKRPWEWVRAGKHKSALDEKGNLTKLPAKAEVGTYTFDPAAIEEKIDAETIEQSKDQGWSWKSLGFVDESRGGATKAEIDALKLLNAFVQNADNKYKQNTLACPRSEIVDDGAGHVTCRRPILYVDDLGSVFGKGGMVTGYSGRTDYEAWKKRRVWKDPATCQARLASIGWIFWKSTLRDPVISEEGRALLAERLAQLSDAQIADLFRASRIVQLHQTMNDGKSGRREVTVADWVELFKQKRDEITNRPPCGGP